jgi:hypothetical protein
VGAPAMPPAKLLLGGLIENQCRAVRFYQFFAALVFLLGASVLAVALFYQRALIPEALKSLVGIGGGFISALSGFPLKEMLTRQEKVGIFRAMQKRMLALEASHDSMDQAERQRYDAILWQAIEKTALS